MGRTSILVDDSLAKGFKFPMKMRISVASNKGDATRRFERLRRNADTSVILVSSKVLNWIESTVSRSTRQKRYPVIVSFPTKYGSDATVRAFQKLLERL